MLTVCAECGTDAVPKGRRLYCSPSCYRKANARQGHAARRERNRRRREAIAVIDGAVQTLQETDPYHRHLPARCWTLRWEFGYRGWPRQSGEIAHTLRAAG